ncbi:MAG: ABC transporter permease [Clostridia bacterium]|nr:ABC transporter permease [Clostridia bacterium]
MRRPFRYFWLLTKRLYKKPSFVALLILIPLAVLAMGLAAKDAGGFVTVALASESPEDPAAREITERLTKDSSLIRYLSFSDADEAREAVENGDADGAWIFPEDTEGRIARFVEEGKDPVVSVYLRENNFFLRMASEKLLSELNRYASQELFWRFAVENVKGAEKMEREDVIDYYEKTEITIRYFDFETAEGTETEGKSYLISPVKGLLALLTVMGAIAAALYDLEDEKAGIYDAIPEKRRGLITYFSLWIAAVHPALIGFFALGLAGMISLGIPELLASLLLSFCSAGFSMILRRLVPKAEALAALLPALLLGMVVLCPIFFDLSALAPLSRLLPPTLYLEASARPSALFFMVLYAILSPLLAQALARPREALCRWFRTKRHG